MLKNIDEQYGKVEFKAPLVVALNLCVDELKAEGDWEVYKSILVSEFDDNAPKRHWI
jgi:aconitate hydratase 2/2-methylisocitrate dehydratase